MRLLPCTLLVLLAGAAHADTLVVPGDAATIQGAIGLAADGDTILVAPGTYPETLDLLGKTIEVIGTGGAEVTIVDATGLGDSVVTLANGEGSATLLQGLTLTGGSGHDTGTSVRGGGLSIAIGADPLVRDCIIEGNVLVSATLPTFGGGVAATGGGRFVDCTIRDNVADNGGGIGAGSSLVPPSLTGCLLEGNQATGSGGGAAGVLTMEACVLSGNTATEGGGLSTTVSALTPSYAGTLFVGNHATGLGGGVHMAGSTVATFIGGTFLGNTSDGLGGAIALEALGDLLVVSSCQGLVMAGNEAASGGDGVFSQTAGATLAGITQLVGCTLVDDGVLCENGSEPDKANLSVQSSIVRTVDPFTVPGTVTATFSDILGGFPGMGNIDADPLFTDPGAGDYSLQPGSPCINTGDPTFPLDPDGSTADMGAIAFSPWADLGGGAAGAGGAPLLAGDGPLIPGTTATLLLTDAPRTPSGATLILGVGTLFAPFKGGVFVPTPDILVPGLPVDGAGSLTLPFTWPAFPSGATVVFQVWIADPGAPFGFAGSNGLSGTTP